jgi:uncharacterized protein
MELTHTFSIPQPVDRAWEVITDLERVAPCLPGAALLSVEGDDYRGAVKIKVGPVTAQYEGVARFAERDDKAHHAVLRAEGRDVRGQGTAAATIDVTLTAQGTGTQVSVDTDLDLAGRVAQFGRGVIADVSGNLIGQFAARLEQEMSTTSAPAPAPAGGGGSAASTVARPARPSIDDVEPLNLMSAGSTAMLKHAVPVATAALGVALGWLLGRRGRSSSATGRVPAGARIVLNIVLPATSHRDEENR